MQTLVFFKEYEFGHVAFLIPPHKRHFFEMLELCRVFNPELKPGPMGDHSKPEGVVTLLEKEYEEAEKEVK